MRVPSEHQLAVLRMYGRLVGVHEDWGGALVLSCGDGAAASGISAAVSIAGGASLAVDADAAAVKAAMRGGEIDFVVNTLDEALRTLKNQVRQKRPLSVGLISDVDTAVAEMVERGVLGDLVVGRAVAGLMGKHPGAKAPNFLRSPMRPEAKASGYLEAETLEYLGAEASGHTEPGFGDSREVWIAASGGALRKLDERLVEMFAGDVVRRRWVERVGQYLRGARDGRWVWLDEAERAELEGFVGVARAAEV